MSLHMGALRLLVFDDDPEDRELVTDALRAAGVRTPPVEVDTLPAALAALVAGPFDACLLDENLGPLRAAEVLPELRAAGLAAPVLIITGNDDEETETRLLRAGVQDYLSKAELRPAVLGRAIVHAIERARSAAAVAESQAVAAAALDALPHVACVLDREGRLAAVNSRWRTEAERNRLGLAEAGVGADYLAITRRAVAAGDRDATEALAALESVRTGQLATCEVEYAHPMREPDGTEATRNFRLLVAPFGGDQPPCRLLIIHEDVTQQRRIEDLRRGSQKMEALGQLAGAVAHDFNNLLTSVRLNAESIADSLPAGDARREELGDLLRAVDQAGGLTRQLLAFGRRQVLQLETLDLGEAVRRHERLLRRVIPESIHLAVEVPSAPLPVLADDTQLMQALLNLAINARDAMATGGTLTISVAARHVARPTAQPDGAMLVAGDWIELAVRDTGPGVDPAILPRIFEPFFSTKTVERGTGLGLAIVHGIVHQLGGRIGVDSVPGLGATFRLYLPRAGHTGDGRATPPPPAAPHGGTILVVEDEPQVRTLLVRNLERQGYTVHAAENGREALAALGRIGDVELVLTDVVMPELGGGALAAAIDHEHPGLPILFVSGYPQDAAVLDVVGSGRARFLGKPFSIAELIGAVEETLELGRRRALGARG